MIPDMASLERMILAMEEGKALPDESLLVDGIADHIDWSDQADAPARFAPAADGS